ncbi:MAG: DEAD/DEAH box helicase [Halioglobus sp.]
MFSELALDRRLFLGLEYMELTEPTEVQQAVVPVALEGGDMRVSAETGSGKTLAYLIPVVQTLLANADQRQPGTQAVIIVPTRELARQVLKQCRKLTTKAPISVQGITGGADFKYQKAIFRKDPEIIIATPGRLLEHCEKHSADLSALQVLVLDEADRVLDMGFRDDVLKINQFCPTDKQVLMLSATLKHKGLGGVARELLEEPQTVTIGEIRQPHSSIFHQMILADSPQHKDKLLIALLQHGGFERALVFSNKRSTAQRLAGLLAYHKLRCATLHGEMSTEERKLVMTRFSDGKLDIVSASDLAARGLDVKNIDLVVNYELPRKGDDYLHRTGRTGRAGAKGMAVSLVDHSEWNLMAAIQRYLKIEFEKRALPGLKARYNGPKATKSSGKAAGSKKKGNMTAEEKAKSRHRHKKNKGKPQTSRSKKKPQENDGFKPLMKKKND